MSFIQIDGPQVANEMENNHWNDRIKMEIYDISHCEDFISIHDTRIHRWDKIIIARFLFPIELEGGGTEGEGCLTWNDFCGGAKEIQDSECV